MKHKIHFPIKKNDVVQLEITGMTAEGWGVGRCEEIAVFVPVSYTHLDVYKRQFFVSFRNRHSIDWSSWRFNLRIVLVVDMFDEAVSYTHLSIAVSNEY